MSCHELDRFREAQDDLYATALRELQSGRKRSHWIWFVFPQIKGLGRSPTSHLYGLNGLSEAREYLADPVLGPRLIEATAAMLAHEEDSAEDILGEVDAWKFRSSLTLFILADPDEKIFGVALRRFFSGKMDQRTIDLLGDDA